ncbi:hypothetical protein OIU35_30455 [Boseaceae bacterium BT-24-1]|nr:hypothetical protein [Boseaceae bacterium BT-24-1]
MARTPINVVFDGADVPFNLATGIADLRRAPEYSGSCCAVVSVGEDKDALGLLSILLRHALRSF